VTTLIPVIERSRQRFDIARVCLVADRASILAGLERQLAMGDKALVGNTGYRRYLKTGGFHRAD
jgi:hypothetical protein